MLGLTIDESIREEIDRRAARLNLSRSSYAAFIMQEWKARGYPAVTEPDKLMQIAMKNK